jgi:hypothetical protein
MLYKLHLNISVVGILTIGYIAAIAVNRALFLMFLVPIVAFISQMCLLLYFSSNDKVVYSDKSLFWTVFSYTVLLGAFFMFISDYYDGDTFMFCKADAMFYYKESMRVQELGLGGNISRIVQEFDFDDWGALICDTIVMYIFPQKLFLNFIYMLLGAFSAVFLFRIGKAYMPERYAFLAALGYSCSSYAVFFNCSFLKEAWFVFLVVSVLFNIHRIIKDQSNINYIHLGFSIFTIFFFRPAVAAFLCVGIFIYYGIIHRGKAISLFLYMAAVGVLLVSFKKAMEIVEWNTGGGSVDVMVEETSNSEYSGGFNYFVSIFGAFFGPFPSILPQMKGPTSLDYLGAGLVYKLFLVFPFWYGVYIIFKEKVLELLPLLIFVLLELLLTGLVCASLELRKVILHVPFMYIVAYFGIFHGAKPAQLSHVSTLPTYLFAIGVLFLWNVIKVKS